MRGSRPVLGEAEGEIPSVYLPLKNVCFPVPEISDISKNSDIFIQTNLKLSIIILIQFLPYLAKGILVRPSTPIMGIKEVLRQRMEQ